MRHHYDHIITRDGTRLATDIYLPAGGGTFPTVIQRTPYWKNDERYVTYGEWLAESGYACVIQDVRGRNDSGGEWQPYDNHEDTDGYDTVAWVIRQPWSNGSVAFTGSSYLAFTGFMAALSGHRAIKALVSRVPASGLFHHHFYFGGIFHLGRLAWGTLVNRRTQQISPGQGGKPLPLFEKLTREDPDIFLHLPVEEIGERFSMPIPWWRTWLQHETEDAYWRAMEVRHQFDRITVPIYHVSGWHDDFCSVALENHAAAGRRSSPLTRNDRLLMGMWPHQVNMRREHGGIDYGEEAIIDLWGGEKEWLDQWLLGKPVGNRKDPPVRLFVMGENRWRHESTWPPAAVKSTPLYLRQKRDLSFDPPGQERADTYVYDPAAPTPQPWDFGEPEMPEVPGWSLDDSERGDRLIFRSGSLEKPLTLIGPVILRLFAATDVPDTDWFAWVGWEEPETKRVRLLTYGHALRARFRRGFTKPVFLSPGKTECYEIDLGSTARRLPLGTRLFCCIQSSCAPWFSRNLNTGGDNYRETEFVKAHQKIYHNRDWPSQILLPIERASTASESR